MGSGGAPCCTYCAAFRALRIGVHLGALLLWFEYVALEVREVLVDVLVVIFGDAVGALTEFVGVAVGGF